MMFVYNSDGSYQRLNGSVVIDGQTYPISPEMPLSRMFFKVVDTTGHPPRLPRGTPPLEPLARVPTSHHPWNVRYYTDVGTYYNHRFPQPQAPENTEDDSYWTMSEQYTSDLKAWTEARRAFCAQHEPSFQAQRARALEHIL